MQKQSQSQNQLGGLWNNLGNPQSQQGFNDHVTFERTKKQNIF